MLYFLNLCEEPAILRLVLLFTNIVRILCILLPLILIIIFIKICVSHVISAEPISKSLNIMFKNLSAALIIFFIPTICSYFFNLVSGYVDVESEFSACFTNFDIDEINRLEKEKIEKSKEDVNDMSEVDREDTYIPWPDDYGNSNSDSGSGNSSSTGNTSSSAGGSPGSSNTNLISASRNIIIGDSRTVGMCATLTGDWSGCQYSNGGPYITGADIYIAQGSMGYSWFSSTAVSAVNSIISANPGISYNIYSLMGVNYLLSDIDKYIPKYIELANGSWSNHNLILVSVNPVDEAKERQYGYSTKQANIVTFNNKLKNGTIGVGNIKYCDTYNSVIGTLQTSDGLHYASSTYKSIYSAMKSCGN